jgi:hypothetical protein
MQIEFIGCTSAGKSTLARDMLQMLRVQGIDAWMDDDFVLKQIGLHWIKNSIIRTLLLDLCSLFACLVTWRNNSRFYFFSIPLIARLPHAVAWPEKLNLARNVLKKIGMYETIHRFSSDQQVILVDEGALQAAHNLFVHVSAQANAPDILAFARLVPLPEMAIYVRQNESLLIERTIRRGHKRIPNRSYPYVERFVKQAIDTFEALVQHLVLEKRLLLIDSNESLVLGWNGETTPLFDCALEAIRAGIGSASQHRVAKITAAPRHYDARSDAQPPRIIGLHGEQL